MPRTPAQLESIQRDRLRCGPFCLWSKYRRHDPVLIPAHDSHHLAHRRPGADVPELCMSLNHAVHMEHHAGLGPSTSELLDIMYLIYKIDLRAKYPEFFGKY